MDSILFRVVDKRLQYLYCTSIVVVVSAICFLFSDSVGYRVTAFILLLVVSLLAMLFDIMPVLLSAVLSAFIWNFFFIPPRFTIHVNTTEDSILLTMYFVIALINGVLTFKIRKIEQAFRLKEERANSVKLYNTILNSLSHELRTPIAAIIGATDNLQLNDKLKESDKSQLISEISKASLRLNQQVENLLNISRLESGHIKPKKDWCDIIELVYDIVKRVEENNHHRKINISITPELPLCLIDRGMLDQIIYNLLNNSAIHTNRKAEIRISAFCHADLLEIIVEDGGNGFKQDFLDGQINKFSRDKLSETSGSGLGLSIVKGFTEALNGKVILEKGELKGAKVCIMIPVKTSVFHSNE